MKLHQICAAFCLVMAAAGCAAAVVVTKPPVTIKILAFNDFHGTLKSPGNFSEKLGAPSVASGGVDFLAGYIAAAKATNPNTVVVSAGDVIGASPLNSAFFHDEGTIETMNRLGLEFNAVGNHEFDEGKDELLRMQNGGCHPSDPNSCKGATVGTPVPFEGAKFKFLSANVFDTANNRTLFAPYGIKVMNGVRVGFIGLTLKDTPTIVTPSGVAGLQFDDEAATVNALVPKLRARGVEAIVVLIHQGGFQTTPPSPSDINGCAGDLGSPIDSPIKTIVSKLDDAVDLVISAHTHAAYNCQLPNLVNRKIPVTSASAFGRVLTDIDMSIDPTTGNVLSVTALNKVVDRTNASITPNAAIQSIVSAYDTLVSPLAGAVIGSLTTPLPNTKDRACNMPAGDIIADSQLLATQPAQFGGAQIAFMNPGGVRNPGFSHAGDITYGEAFTVQPFGNSLVTMTVTAQVIKNALEQQFVGCLGQTTNKVLLPSAGFKYDWDNTLPACQKVKNVVLTTAGVPDTLVDASGVVVNPAASYRITVNNFLSTGGDGFTAFTNGTNFLGGAQDIDALVAYMSAFKSPAPAYDPADPALGKPRISRLDAGSSCP